MTAWYDNQPFGYTFYGISTNGIEPGSGTVGEFSEFTGQPLVLLPSLTTRFCRPPDGTGHLIIHIVTFFDASLASVGSWELWNADYFLALDPTYPTGYSEQDTIPFGTAETFPTAVWYGLDILDLGPYDIDGNTPSDTADFSPYTDADTALANAYACGAANLTGARGPGEVHFS